MSENGVHLFIVEEQNLEYLLCDECLILWDRLADVADDEDTGLTVCLLPASLEEGVRAATNVSAEGQAHMCGDHQHAACEHIYQRLLLVATAGRP